MSTLPDETRPPRQEVFQAIGTLNMPSQSSPFDELTLLTAYACNAPIVVIALLEGGHERIKSRRGLPSSVEKLPQDAAISAPAVAARELVVISDARSDPHLSDHPFVRGEPYVRFYAAAPLMTGAGNALGALVIMDREPRDLAEKERAALSALARQCMALLELRRSVATLRREMAERERAQRALAASETDFRQLAESLPQIIWVRRRDGTLDFVNQRGLEFTGLSFAQMAPASALTDTVHPDDRSRVEQAWREATATGQPLEVEVRLRRHDGVYRWYLTRATPIHDRGGEVVKWMGMSTDVHDVKESNERSAFQLALSTELAGISDPQELICVAMLRLRDRLRVARVTIAEVEPGDHEAIVLTQCDGEEGRLEVSSVPLEDFSELAEDARQGLTTVICDTRADNRSAGAYETWYRPRAARAIVAVPLLRGGEMVALLSVVDSEPRDWTASEIELVKRVADIVWPAFEKARAERALMISEERMRLAQGTARIGAWEWDPENNHCFFSPEGYDLFGLDPDTPHLFDELLGRVSPQDSHQVRAALDACRRTGTTEIECRYHHPTRGLRWLHVKAGTVLHAGHPCIVGIGMDVTERKQAEEALKEMNQRKDEFLAMLAHELRNPLAPIRNAAQILRVHGKGNLQLDWARAVIERQARHLTRLVDDLLDVSRIVRGQVALERSVLDLGTVVRNAVETSRPLLREKRHRLDVVLPDQPVRVDGDLTRLSQVVSNLLINAAKYTNDGGEVRVEAYREGDQAVVRVSDNGIGIAPELLPHIFDLFTQGERALDRSQGGLGIGLTLVKRIVEMHGGTVEAVSAGPGRGSEFTVKLPALQARPTKTSVERAKPAAARTRHLRILVVDDNVDAAESIAMLLRMEGHDVRTVHAALAALETAPTFHPDVVLLDIGLPGMDGYEVARRLRARTELAHMRLIAVTGYGQQEDRDRAMQAGFDQHLVKPVEPDALNAVLRTAPTPQR